MRGAALVSRMILVALKRKTAKTSAGRASGVLVR